ncbi:hypothetical protein RJ639_005034 [Escallonia herrerae]|uniref:KIB1-4 beta-propeller domain-containing protein n=1 Tax=Escallonia herrerae TaxID=1293975 RepID=A0AA88W4I9_9ASTE|nr:hypothetical protein RJ639_005034 [Escallonia herrerae]
MVVRLFTETHPVVLRTNRFIIFRTVVDHESRCDQHPKWVRVESLGDQALFLGRNHSQPVSVSDSLNFQENCIYYADQDYPVCYGPSNKDLFRYGDWGALRLDGSRVESFGPKRTIFFAKQLPPAPVALNSAAVSELATRLKHLDFGDSQATKRRNEIEHNQMHKNSAAFMVTNTRIAQVGGVFDAAAQCKALLQPPGNGTDEILDTVTRLLASSTIAAISHGGEYLW